jgi:putative endonuclease
MKPFYVYILTNDCSSIFYIGVTQVISDRIWEHKNQYFVDFVKKHKLDRLVHYEPIPTSKGAILREKYLKSKTRQDIQYIVAKYNPEMQDLLKKTII